MLFVTLMLATASPAPQTADQAATPQEVYDMAVTCASAQMVGSIVVGQMGDTEQQAHMRRLSENFETVAVNVGATLGHEAQAVRNSVATEAAARIAPLEQMATASNRQAQLGEWARLLNEQNEECRAFAASLAEAARAG